MHIYVLFTLIQMNNVRLLIFLLFSNDGNPQNIMARSVKDVEVETKIQRERGSSEVEVNYSLQYKFINFPLSRN
jgi:hypothetical protein